MEVKEGKVGLDTEEPKAGRSIHANPAEIPAVENFEVDSVHLNVNTVAVSSQVTLTKKSKLKEKVRDGRSLPVKGKQVDFSETLKEKLQHKDLENQHTVRMLLMFYRELKDKMETWKMTEVKAELMAEKLKQEEEKNLEVTERFNSVCEDMRAEICIAKSNNESFVKQLKALLEKYERLQKRASTFKQQLLEERTKKKMYQKTVNKTQQMAEELLMNRTLLEEQMDDAMRELCEYRKKIQTMEEEQEHYVGTVKAAEEERSALKAEYCSLGEQLWKTREENKKLAQAVNSKELEKGRAERNLQESQKAVKQLYEELGESKTKTDSIYLQFESMKKECKLLYNRHKVEILNLKEQQKACVEQFESMKTECKTLNGVVCKLKKDKCLLIGELETLRKEKEESETASKREAERLRGVVALLERERELLLNEMGDLRKDYLSLSDRITQRIRQLDQTDDPMCITEISVHHHMAPKTDKAVAPIASVNMIEQIRRKLEDEEKCFHKQTGVLLQQEP